MKRQMLPRLQGDSGGLSLIEILVALGILSVVLLAVYGTFFSVHAAIEASDHSMLRFREVRMFFDLIRREIESAYIETGSEESGTFFRVRDRDLYGKRLSELGFTSFAPYGSGLYAIEYAVDDERGILRKNVVSFFRDEQGDRVEVLEGIEEFQVEVNSSGRWVGTFDNERVNKLPDAVRVSVTVMVKGELLTLRETVYPKVK